jgi:hypothetical protein
MCKSSALSTKPTNSYVDMCSGLPLHKNVQWLATAQPLHRNSRIFVLKCWILLPLEEFLCTCKKTVQVLFPHPTVTGKSHTTNNTMTDHSTSAATTADTAANAARCPTTKNDTTDISGNKDGSEDDSKDEASDDDKGTDNALFHAARDIQNRTSRCAGTAGMEDYHFCIFLAQIYQS